MQVAVFTDYVTEYYIHPADEESPRSNAVATIEIPDDLYPQWLAAREAWRAANYEIETAMHQAVYE